MRTETKRSYVITNVNVINAVPSTTTATTTTTTTTTTIPQQLIFAEFVEPVSISDFGLTRYITPAWNVWCTDNNTHGIYTGYRCTWTRYDGSIRVDNNWIDTYVVLDNTWTFYKDASFSCHGNDSQELILDMFILEIVDDNIGTSADPGLAIDSPETYGFKLLKSIRYTIDCYDLL